MDHTLRYQLQTESLRNKVDRPESKNPTGNLILPSTRLKTQGNSPLQRPNLVHPHQTHHSPAILPTNFEQDNVFEQSGQIRYIIPLSNTPPPFQKAASIRRAKPNDAGLFNSPNRDYKIQNGFKSNTRQSNQHYNQKYNDNKIAPSRGGSIFATPPKLRDREIPASTTSSPKKSELMTSSGQKKINYNYHPIIDFFRTDSNSKKGSVSSGSQNHVTSQDWTPVLGHQSLPNWSKMAASINFRSLILFA